jgi:DNA-binding transcriptional MerR regulator
LTVRNWDQKGRLKAYRNPMNNYRLYKISDVEELLHGIEKSRTGIPQERKKIELAQTVQAIEEARAEQIIEVVPASQPEKTIFKKLPIETE